MTDTTPGTLPADYLTVLAELHRLMQPVTIALAELGPILAAASNARVVPSDRFSVNVVPIADTPTAVIGRQADRARITLYNSGANVVHLGRDSTVTATGSNRFPLPVGSSITVDTKAGWFARCAAGLTGELALINEEYDA